jgi:hypothetical protein
VFAVHPLPLDEDVAEDFRQPPFVLVHHGNELQHRDASGAAPFDLNIRRSLISRQDITGCSTGFVPDESWKG